EVREPLFLPVAAATRRHHAGELVSLETPLGGRVRCTPDHPMLVDDGAEGVEIREAGSLRTADRLPFGGRCTEPAPRGVTWNRDGEGQDQPAADGMEAGGRRVAP